MKKVKRKYESRHRQTLAGQTRSQILDAARRLFRTKGYGQVTIEGIARAARVAAPTVYAAFGGKRAILLKLLDEMEQAADTAALLAEIDARAGDARARLRAFVDFSVRLFTEGADVIRIAELAGKGDRDVAALWRLGDERRLETCKVVLGGLGSRNMLRDGLTEAAAEPWHVTRPASHAAPQTRDSAASRSTQPVSRTRIIQKTSSASGMNCGRKKTVGT